MQDITIINQRLIDYYGIDTITGRPIFRVVWANDQTEQKLTSTLDSGIQLLYPEVREVKKYPYLKDFWVLERLVIVPDANQPELPISKLSYEPLWSYRDENDKPLQPIWEGTKFIVDTVYAALGKKSLAKYKESEETLNPEIRVAKIEKELFGNETEVTDALAHDEAIVVPHNYEKG